jgi:hypothetical protein
MDGAISTDQCLDIGKFLNGLAEMPREMQAMMSWKILTTLLDCSAFKLENYRRFIRLDRVI